MTPKPKLRRGVPVDGRDWTEADWLTLFKAIEAAKAEIAARHNKEEPAHGKGPKPVPRR